MGVDKKVQVNSMQPGPQVEPGGSDYDEFPVMDFVAGETLQEKLTRGPVPTHLAVKYMEQVLNALDHAHSQGVVHRDVKPANILITPNGSVKLIDFGIAKAVRPEERRPEDRSNATAYIASAEINGSIDARADVYSTGVILYELLTGTNPFESVSGKSRSGAQVGQPPVPPNAIKPQVPSYLNDAILKAMANEPWRRYQSAAEFRDAISGRGPSFGPTVLPNNGLFMKTAGTFARGAALCFGAMIVTAAVLFFVSLTRAHPVATSTAVSVLSLAFTVRAFMASEKASKLLSNRHSSR